MQKFSNNTLGAILLNALSPSDTTATLQTGLGAKFSEIVAPDFEMATMVYQSTIEVIKITAHAAGTDVFTIVRAQEGTTAGTFPASSAFEARLTAGSLEQMVTDIINKLTVDNGGDARGALSLTIQPGRESDDQVASGDGAIAIGANSKAANDKSVISGLDSTDSPSAWSVSTSYIDGDIVTGSSKVFICTQSGTSGGTEPTWNTTTNATTSDNTVIWTCAGAANVSQEKQAGYGWFAASVGTRAAAFGGYAFANANGSAFGANAWAFGDNAAFGMNARSVSDYGGIALGAWSTVTGVEYCIAIGADQTNQIQNTHAIGGYSIVRRDDGGVSGYNEVDYAAQENYIFSEVVDVTQTAVDDLISIGIPTGSAFFVTEVGFIISTENTITVQPQISFGISGNTTALLASTPLIKSVVRGKDSFNSITADGQTGAILASLKVSATATAMTGRFYAKGILVEDQ